MLRLNWLGAALVGLALATTACGGGGGSADGAKDASAAEGKAIDRLKAQVDGLDAEVNGLFKPVDDLDAAIELLAKLPAELKASANVSIDAKAFASVGKGVVGGGKIDLSGLKLDANAEAKAKVEEAFAKLEAAFKGVAETDAKVKAIGDKFVAALVEVPKLGAEATASASIDMSNPFAGAEVQAQAKADIDTIKGIVDGFPAKVDGWKSKVTELPAKATASLDKAKAAFN